MPQTFSAVRRFRSFAHEHDDVPAFHAAYLVGTFLAAALLNLSFFGLLIVAHMSLDYVKYRAVHGLSIGQTAKAMLRESMIDIALLLLALTFVVYLHHSFAIVAVSGLARAELTILRAVGTMAPKIRIFEHALSILLNIEQYAHDVAQNPDRPFRTAETWAFWTILACTALLFVAVTVVFRGHQEQIWGVVVREFSLVL